MCDGIIETVNTPKITLNLALEKFCESRSSDFSCKNIPTTWACCLIYLVFSHLNNVLFTMDVIMERCLLTEDVGSLPAATPTLLFTHDHSDPNFIAVYKKNRSSTPPYRNQPGYRFIVTPIM